MYYTDAEISRLFGEKIEYVGVFNLIKPHKTKRNIYLVDIADYKGSLTPAAKRQVQQAIRETCAYNQKYIDPLSGDTLHDNAQLHHHLITKAMVIKNEYSYLIHASLNCLMLNPDTHLNSGLAGNKQFGASVLTSLYGSLPELWYMAFPTRVPFPGGVFA